MSRKKRGKDLLDFSFLLQKAHYLPTKKICRELRTNPNTGLTTKEVQRRLRLVGYNKIEKEKERSLGKIFLIQLLSPLSVLLFLAALMVLVVEPPPGNFLDASFIIAVLFLNSFLGTYQEAKARKILSELEKKSKKSVVVKREGRLQEVLPEEIVPGDIVVLYPSSVVPGDGRVLKAHNLFVSQAHLSGEWEPEEKHPDLLPPDTPLLERKNILYKGSLVESGRGEMVIIGTGERTEVGKIIKTFYRVSKEPSFLQRKIKEFTEYLSRFLILWGLGIIAISLLQKRPILESLEIAIAVVVGAIPEALPLIITISLAIKSSQIGKKGVLTKNLQALEPLASINLLCVDKTGTLTQGKMEALKIVTSDHEISLPLRPTTSLEKDILYALWWANGAHLIQNKELKIIGTPTDKALLQAGIKSAFPRKGTLIKKIPFSPLRKYQGALVKTEEGEKWYLAGSPEKVLSHAINPETEKASLLEKTQSFTREGYRVIALAKSSNLKEPEKGWEVLGLVVISDPLRKDVKKAWMELKKLGLQTLIITGDHKNITLNILERLQERVSEDNLLSGKELEELPEEVLLEKITQVKAFYRTSPHQKLKIVQLLKQKGYKVGMLGDGANDILALKEAHVGISLAQGTEVAKETADFVLTENNLANLTRAIIAARNGVKNIERSVSFVLFDSFASAFLITTSLLLGLPIPFWWTQILFNNIIEDSFPPLAFIMNPKETFYSLKDFVSFLPQKMFLFSLLGSFISQGLMGGAYIFLYYSSGWELDLLRTIFFAVISLNTLFIMLPFSDLEQPFWRSKFWQNRYFLLAGLLIIIALLAGIYWPPLASILRARPLQPVQWGVVLGLCLVWSGVIEGYKALFIKSTKKNRS